MMAESPNAELITRLPPSPSSSVLSLDAHSEPEEADPKRVLGIRELRKFSRNGRKSPEVQKKEILVLGHPDTPSSSWTESQIRHRSEIGNFAREVTVKGWKVVGGKGGGDRAKVGAYVGMSTTGLISIVSPKVCC